MNNKKIPGLSCLDDLASYMEYDEYVYLLKELYRIIFRAKRKRASPHQLLLEIRAFEEQADLPVFLSQLQIDELINQLEDAQYFYPIRKHDVYLPRFIEEKMI